MKKLSLFVIFLFLTFFIDDQLSFFLSSLTNYGWVFTSLSFIITLFYIGMVTTTVWLYPILLMLGVFYDTYYFSSLGLASWIFPLLYFLIGYLRPLFFQGFWERFLMMFIFLTLLPVIFYGLAYIYGLTKYPITYFITFNLAPSLLLICLNLLLFQPLYDKILLEI